MKKMFDSYKITNINGEVIEQSLSKRIIDILIASEASLVYRGIHPRQYDELLDEDLFIVGEKSKIFDVKPHEETEILTARYFKSAKKRQAKLDKTKIKLLETLEQFSKRKKLSLDTRYVEKEIEKIINKKRLSPYNIYLFMKAIIHKLQDEEFSLISPFLSTSRRKDIATSYSKEVRESKNGEDYSNSPFFRIDEKRDSSDIEEVPKILLIHTGGMCSEYISMSKIEEFARSIGIDWFSDKDDEVLFIRGVLPHNILGCFNNNEKKFVVNPGLEKILDMYLINAHIVKILESVSLPIDQRFFGKAHKRLGYNAFYEHDGDIVRLYSLPLEKRKKLL